VIGADTAVGAYALTWRVTRSRSDAYVGEGYGLGVTDRAVRARPGRPAIAAGARRVDIVLFQEGWRAPARLHEAARWPAH